MKKASIIICAAIYALAIIVVAFLGYAAEIQNPPVYADDIVLLTKTPYEHVENGALIYTITENKPKNEEVEETSVTSVDEEPETFYKYDVHIWDFEYLFEVMEGKISIAAKPISFKVDDEGKQKEPEKKELGYTTASPNATIDNNGLVTFNKYKSDGTCICTISSKDVSKIKIFVNIYW